MGAKKEKKGKKKKEEKQEEVVVEEGPGIKPCFLTNTTQEIFGLKTPAPDAEGQVTAETPFKLIDKEEILKDIQFRGAISDLHPQKAFIEHYPDQQILFVWDEEEEHGENFYFFANPSGKEEYLQAYEEANRKKEEQLAEAEQEEEKGPKGWIMCSNAEEEISEFYVKPNRERIFAKFSRPRRQFAQNFEFSDRETTGDLTEFLPFKDPNFELQKMEHEQGVQAVPSVVDNVAQTTWYRPVQRITQYEPVDIDPTAKEKIMESEDFQEFLHNVSDVYHESLEQNETYNMFDDDFSSLAEEDSAVGNEEESILKELQSFSDLDFSQDKIISAIDWHPKDKGVAAVSCVKRWSFDERVDHAGKVTKGYILVWNFLDPIHPHFVLETPADLFTFKYNPTSPEIIVGGCHNGQVVLYDLTDAIAEKKKRERNKNHEEEEGGAAKKKQIITWVNTSSIETSHKRAVSSIQWLDDFVELNNKGKPGKNEDRKTNQFASLAGDGTVLIWDLRYEEMALKRTGGDPSKKGMVAWNPLIRISLGKLDAPGDLTGAQISLTSILTRGTMFYVTTEEGQVACCDLITDNAAEGGDEDSKAIPRHVKWTSHAHFGPCVALDRSPFFPNVLLSAGGWTFSIWKEGVETPVFTSPYSSTFITSAVWSPIRPGVIFTGMTDGSINVWDFTDRSHEPSQAVNFTSTPITALQFVAHDPGLLAVGDNHGILHILEVPRTLRRSIHTDEKGFMTNFVDREVNRLEYVRERSQYWSQEKDRRQKEDEERKRVEEEAAAQAEAGVDEEILNDEEKKAQEAYRAMEDAFRKELGLVDPNSAAVAIEKADSVGPGSAPGSARDPPGSVGGDSVPNTPGGPGR